MRAGGLFLFHSKKLNVMQFEANKINEITERIMSRCSSNTHNFADPIIELGKSDYNKLYSYIQCILGQELPKSDDQDTKAAKEPTTLQVMHRMVSDSNNGISLATTIAEVKGTKQGVVVGFGMQEQFAGAANMEWMGVGSDTIFLAFTINRDQLAKTKAKMMEE